MNDDVIVANPGGGDDPLGESVLDEAAPWLRVFEPRDVRLVIGRGQDPQREVLVDQARADGVPIHRRLSGGGAVVLAPGMVVVAMRLVRPLSAADSVFAAVNRPLIEAVFDCGGPRLRCRGHGDLTLDPELAAGSPRKVLGASLRQRRDRAYYLGVLLVADAVDAMERYLAAPSRTPDYRGDRGHRDFVDHLDRFGVETADLVTAIRRRCEGHPALRPVS